MRRSLPLRIVDLWFLALGIAVSVAAINGAFNTQGAGRALALGLLAVSSAAVSYRAGRAIVRDWA